MLLNPCRVWIYKMGRRLLGTVVMGGIILLITIIVMEWLVGCGEKTYHRNGTWITGECLFVPYEVTHGYWK